MCFGWRRRQDLIRDRCCLSSAAARFRTAAWSAWLVLTLLTHVYLFAMIGSIYVASLLRRRRVEPSRRPLAEPAFVVGAVIAVMVIAGHVGPGTGTSPFAGGFGGK